MLNFNIHVECLEHNHDKSKKCNFGFFCKVHALQHNLAGAQPHYVHYISELIREPFKILVCP